MSRLTIDLETYSPHDIHEVGMYRYAQHPDFRVLLYSDSKGRCVDLTETGALPEDVLRDLSDKDITKCAHNAAFEWWCLSEHMHLGQAQRERWIHQWEDTMVHMLYCGLPGSLAAAGSALHLSEDKAKMREGTALITYFCKPCKPTKANGGRTRNLPRHAPDRWVVFKAYNARDVEAEEELDRRMAAWPVPEALWREWREDTIANSRGIGVDTGLVAGALRIAQAMEQAHQEEFAQLTQGCNPKSPVQLLAWLAQHGASLPDIRKDTVAQTLARDDLPDNVRRALELRQLLGKSSNTKYEVLRTATSPDRRIRGCLQFYGAARTGRWAGRLLQVQNLPRTYIHGEEQPDVREIIRLGDGPSLEAIYGDANNVLSQMIRTALVPAKGATYIDADFSAIEARLIAWLAGEEWVLDIFRGDGKIYEATAARIYGVSRELIVKGRPEYAYRQRGKVATLALGYQGGVGAMRRMDFTHALDALDDSAIQDIVNRWRSQNPNICRLWRRMQNCAVRTIQTGQPTQPRPGVVFRLETSAASPFAFLTLQLPSGRKLFYADPGVTPDERITYWEQEKGTWTQSESYGGKLTENLTQACGRDILAYALKGLRDAGYFVPFHIHDEVVVETHTDDPEAELARIREIMSRVPPWAKGLPLNAEGWYGRFFTKD